MVFGLYTLLEASLLLVNAVAILNDQRFLAKCNNINAILNRIILIIYFTYLK